MPSCLPPSAAGRGGVLLGWFQQGLIVFPSHLGELLRGPGVVEIECVLGNGGCSFQRCHFPP